MAKTPKNKPKSTNTNTNQRKPVKERFKQSKGADLPKQSKLKQTESAKPKLDPSKPVEIISPVTLEEIRETASQQIRRVLRPLTNNITMITKISKDASKEIADKVALKIKDNANVSPLQEIKIVQPPSYDYSIIYDSNRMPTSDHTNTNSTNRVVEDNTVASREAEETKPLPTAQLGCPKSADLEQDGLTRSDVVNLLKDLISKAKEGDTSTADAIRVADLVAKFGGMYGQLETEVNVNLVMFDSEEYNKLMSTQSDT